MAEDIASVMTVVNLYPIALDSRRWELFDRIFTPDIHADYGGGAVWSDLASFKRDFDTIHVPFELTHHATANHAITVSGDGANCLSYVHARFVRHVGGSAGNFYEVTGWYDDELVRTAEGWRIARRVSRSNWANGNPAVLGTVEGITHVKLNILRDEAAAGNVAFLKAILA